MVIKLEILINMIFLLQSFDITPITTDPFEPIKEELISTNVTTNDTTGAGDVSGITEESSLTIDTDDSAGPLCQLADDNLLDNDVTATVVYTASAFEANRFSEIAKQKFELERL